MTRLLALLLLMLVDIAALPAALAEGEVVEVKIDKYLFEPRELRIKVGTTVKWVNHEKRTSHSVIWIGPGGFESERLLPGDSYQRTFDKPGTYRYTCGPHPEMLAVVIVTE